MMMGYRQSRITHLNGEISQLQRQIADKLHAQSNITRKIADLNRDISRPLSEGQRTWKLRDLEQAQRELARTQEELSRMNSDMARKQEEVGHEHEQLTRDQERVQQEQERKQRWHTEVQNQKMRELEAAHEAARQEIETMRAAAEESAQSESNDQDSCSPKEYDFFISHATEDKEACVEPLANQLIQRGARVWYDRFELHIGDSLRKSIDAGLAASRFGIVVLSNSFFAKKWPEYELNGLVAREMSGRKVVLPIWHMVTKDDVIRFSPTLADKVALSTATMSVGEIADALCTLIQQIEK